MILCSDPKAQYLSYKREIDTAIAKVLDSGWYIMGNEVKSFEDEFSKYIGVSHAVGVGSGTEALHLALAACGVVQGDEVITVSHTAVATVAAIILCGAIPVFTDIDPKTYTMSVDSLEDAITSRTKAIIPVHLYGHPAEMDKICELADRNGIYVIEDCAQAHGAMYKNKRVGSLGHIGCFSFYPTKNLGALGDAGIVVTDNSMLAEKLRLLHEYGWEKRFVSKLQGWNSRLDEIQAAVLRVKLKYLDKDNAMRINLASEYISNLENTNLIMPFVKSNCTHVFHLFVVRSPERDQLLEYLHKAGVGAAIHYPVPVHLQPAYSDHKIRCPETEKACKEIISFPIYPELGEKIITIISSIKEFKK
ncbi:MAG: DegT/DnrJ/EryC1/StrS family aminotransferase [Desulfamplus sp.]|nr:DegT/DnrJ/EryC1/StrS family aminotransferase [Desulfamplus sp.]